MGWALAILFSAAVVLLIVSFIKAKQANVKSEQQIDQLSFTLMDEIHQLQQHIRNLELDAEIVAYETNIPADVKERRILVREMLDLHRRGYSFESIGLKKKLTQNEVEQMLLPYTKKKEERKMA